MCAKISNKIYDKPLIDSSIKLPHIEKYDETWINSIVEDIEEVKKEEVKPKNKRTKKVKEESKSEIKKTEPTVKEKVKKVEQKVEEVIEEKEEDKYPKLDRPLTQKEICYNYLLFKEPFRIYFRGAILYDSKVNTEIPIFENNHFFLYGKKYIYKGIRIEKY